MQETINIIHYNINIIQIYIQLYHSSSFQHESEQEANIPASEMAVAVHIVFMIFIMYYSYN